MSRKHVNLVWVALALSFMCQATLFAQAPTGTILGTVKDPSGAVVPKATVTITNQNTQFKRSMPTNDSGDYQFTLVDASVYTLSVESPGFKKYVQPDVPLTARQILRVDITVQVGQTAETVTVTATVTPVNSESVAIGESYSAAGLDKAPMPLPMYNYPIFAMGQFSLQSVSTGGMAYLKINGTRTDQARVVIDGRVPPYSGSVPMTALEELKMTSVSANAEYTMPATIQATSKGGTNTFHASADGTLSHPNLNSIGPYYYPRPPGIGTWNAAFTGSGPVIIPKVYNGKDRTWFYVMYERMKNSSGNYSDFLNVPTVRMRNGDFSEYKDNTGAVIPIIDPLTGQQFAGNIIPPDRISSVGANIRDEYPLPNQADPNSTFQNYLFPSFSYYNQKQHNRFFRFDQKLSNRDTLSYNHLLTMQDSSFDVWASGWAKLPHKANAVISTFQFSHAFAETHVFSPTIVNEARYAFDRLLQPFGYDKNGQDFLRDWGITGIDPSLNFTGVPNIQFSSGSGTGTPALAGIGQKCFFVPGESLSHRSSFLDNLTWVKGKHTIKTGANYTLFNLTKSGSPVDPFGQYLFTGRLTQGNLALAGSAWADLLLGYPDTVIRFTPRSTTLPNNFLFGAYIQDDWKVTPRLTMNFGVRYDLEGSPIDKNGLYYGFDPKNGALVFPTQFAMNHVSPLFNSAIPLELVSAAGFPGKIIPVDKNNFAPRLGFAFRPFNNAQTVIRAAYGIYTTGKLGTLLEGTEGGYLNSTGPFALQETFINQQPGGGTVGAPTLAFPSPFLASTGGPSGASYDVSFVTPNYHDPYVQQWNVTAEQEWWKTAFRFSYVGSKGTNSMWSRNINQVPASTTPFNISDCANPETGRPNPLCRRNYYGFNSVNMTDNGGNDVYHSAQFEFTHPFTKGFQLHGGYVWAKMITDVEETLPYNGPVGIDPYNRKYNRGPANNIPTQRFMFDFVWQLPVGRGQRFLSSAPGVVNQILGGWQASWYSNYMTGTPFSVTYSGRDTSGTGVTSGRPDQIASGRISNPSQNNWFDPSAFVVPPCGTPDPVNYPSVTCMPIGRFGNAGRNNLYGPVTNFNYGRTEMAALMKVFPLYKEKLKFRFAIYVTNPFNRNYLYTPNSNISDFTNVGKQTRYGTRTVQLGGKLEF